MTMSRATATKKSEPNWMSTCSATSVRPDVRTGGFRLRADSSGREKETRDRSYRSSRAVRSAKDGDAPI